MIQYVAVGILILLAIIWIVIKLVKLNRNKGNGACCGCSLSDVCADKKKKTAESCEKQDSAK